MRKVSGVFLIYAATHARSARQVLMFPRYNICLTSFEILMLAARCAKSTRQELANRDQGTHEEWRKSNFGSRARKVGTTGTLDRVHKDCGVVLILAARRTK